MHFQAWDPISVKTEEKPKYYYKKLLYFKTKLKDIALPSLKLFNENCKFENNLSAGEINSFKALMRNKNIIIQKTDKGNTVAITDKEKYIEGVKRVFSNSNKFVQLDITPDEYLNYIKNVEKKFKQLFRD